MIRIAILKTVEQLTGLADSWAGLLRQDAGLANGIGIYGTSDWTLSLWENHLQSRPQNILVLEDEGEICAILPFHRRINGGFPLRERVIEPITEIVSGRAGFLLKHASPDYLEAIFRFLYAEVPGWNTFRCTLVDGSASDQAFAGVAANGRYHVANVGSRASPYICLPAQLASYLAGLSKNFRDNLKKSERRLRKAGTLAVRFHQKPEEVADFISAVLSVERRSWKELAGTSITTNPIQEGLYRRFLTSAAENGWLLGTVLSVDDNPLAYAMGFIFENIYYNEKASYDESMRASGAGSYIYLPIIEELYRRGVRLFDFMGKCEEFKMRWTQATYTRTTWMLYNNSVGGNLLRAKHAAGRLLDRIKGGKDDSEQSPGGDDPRPAGA